jgi:hypothetical protein
MRRAPTTETRSVCGRASCTPSVWLQVYLGCPSPSRTIRARETSRLPTGHTKQPLPPRSRIDLAVSSRSSVCREVRRPVAQTRAVGDHLMAKPVSESKKEHIEFGSRFPWPSFGRRATRRGTGIQAKVASLPCLENTELQMGSPKGDPHDLALPLDAAGNDIEMTGVEFEIGEGPGDPVDGKLSHHRRINDIAEGRN